MLIKAKVIQLIRRFHASLEMVWPESKLTMFPKVMTPRAGYTLRQFNTNDKEKYSMLLSSCELLGFSFSYWEKHILPNGFFVVEHNATGVLVAGCMAAHHPTIRHHRAGTLGWLAVDPKHRGRGLGGAVSSAVTARLLEVGYQRLYLETQDIRLAAIKIYLKLGWVPLLYKEDMCERWKIIFEKLSLKFNPTDYPSA
jgi:mycothiol synthase